MSRAAKYTLAGAVFLSSLTVWAVHYQQERERKTMYAGVLRDDERRSAKMRKREDDLMESRRKRELYGSVQSVSPDDK